jgi:hypothetical protein
VLMEPVKRRHLRQQSNMRAEATMVEFRVGYHRETLRSDANSLQRAMDCEKNFISHDVCRRSD